LELLPGIAILLLWLDDLAWLIWSLPAPVETSLLCWSLRLVASAVGIAIKKTVAAFLDLRQPLPTLLVCLWLWWLLVCPSGLALSGTCASSLSSGVYHFGLLRRHGRFQLFIALGCLHPRPSIELLPHELISC
jgi:hypothetical protein